MECGIYPCPPAWRKLLPPGVRAAETVAGTVWDLLALTPAGLSAQGRCRVLLAPGNGGFSVQAERVVTYGLSPRDSLTLSSLRAPVLCIQRTLPRPDGGVIEPQELPLPPLPGPAEELLPLLGLRLLQMPLDGTAFLW